MQYYAILCNTMRYYAILCNTMHTLCSTMQYYTILCNTMHLHWLFSFCSPKCKDRPENVNHAGEPCVDVRLRMPHGCAPLNPLAHPMDCVTELVCIETDWPMNWKEQLWHIAQCTYFILPLKMAPYKPQQCLYTYWLRVPILTVKHQTWCCKGTVGLSCICALWSPGLSSRLPLLPGCPEGVWGCVCVCVVCYRWVCVAE